MRRLLFGQFAALVVVFGACAALSAPALAIGTVPSGLAVSPDGTTLYATRGTSNAVAVIDTSTDQVTDTIAVDAAPSALALSPDGDTLYVANYGSDDVSVIDTTTDQVTDTIAVDAAPNALALSPTATRSTSPITAATTSPSSTRRPTR